MKDLLGTYQLHNCSKNLFGEVTPVYRRVLDDGTEAFIYKARIGVNWQVLISTINNPVICRNTL